MVNKTQGQTSQPSENEYNTVGKKQIEKDEKNKISQVYVKIELESKEWRGGESKLDLILPQMSLGCSTRKEWWGKFAKEIGVSTVPVSLIWTVQEMADSKTTFTALDVGCGNSGAAFYLLERGWQVIAIDNNPEVIEVLKTVAHQRNPDWLKSKQLIPVCKNLEDMTKLSRQVDLIVATHILEYCNPLKIKTIWESLYTFLKPGGYIVGDLQAKNLIKKVHPRALELFRGMGQWFGEDESVGKELLYDRGYKSVFYQVGSEKEPSSVLFVGKKAKD